MPNTALLVIDVQQGLFEEDPPTINAESLVARINPLAERAREAGAPVIYIQDDRVGAGAADELLAGLKPARGDKRMRKRHCDSFFQTNLQDILGDAKRLVICGCQTDQCVAATARGAVAMGYDVEVAADAHSTSDNPFMSAEKTIEFFNTWILDGFGGDDVVGKGEHRIVVKPAAEIEF